MSVTFGVSAWAGPGVVPDESDEGERCRSFMADVLKLANKAGLNASINNIHPVSRAPGQLVSYVAGDPSSPDYGGPGGPVVVRGDPGTEPGQT